MKKLLWILTLSLSAFATEKLPLDTVDYVDLNRYLGRWYEIARFDFFFEKGCTATEANYSLRKDGEVKVVNKCRIGSPNGELRQAEGRAWVVDNETNAKLKVQFFLTSTKIPFIAGNYWVLDIDEDYQYALVGDQSRRYLWILSRTKTLDERIYEELVAKAKDMHFDTSKLLRTVHSK